MLPCDIGEMAKVGRTHRLFLGCLGFLQSTREALESFK